MPRLNDEELREIVAASYTPLNLFSNLKNVAAELIERRAADAPFAVGDKVTVGDDNSVWEVVAMDIVYLRNAVDAYRNRYAPLSTLTPVPAAATAAEVFEAAFAPMLDSRSRAADFTTLGVVSNLAEAAFREFCAAAGIDPDAPLVTDSEVAS